MRLLSAMPLRTRPRLVTTDGEFHTIRRQLDRLAEEGLDRGSGARGPLESLATRLGARGGRSHAPWCWSRPSSSTPAASPAGSPRWPRAAGAMGAACWWTLTTRSTWCPFSLADEGLGDAFVVGGGYKYCQLGEGNCFLRIPPDTDLRPVVTGWYSEFTALADRERRERVAYGQGGDRFAGATYDPTSHYRAAAVFDFFREHGLTPGAPAAGEPASDRGARLDVRCARPRPGDREPRPRLPLERDRRVSGAAIARSPPRWRGGSTRVGSGPMPGATSSGSAPHPTCRIGSCGMRSGCWARWSGSSRVTRASSGLIVHGGRSPLTYRPPS